MSKEKIKELTKAEEQIMQILWQLGKGFVKEIVEKMDEPKPAYNTVSTIVRILETKGFIDHQAFGKTHEYFPLISKEEYKKSFLKNFVHNYFGSSYKQLVSFFSKEEQIDLKELEDLKSLLEEEINKQKNA